jgi:hypothetical protein
MAYGGAHPFEEPTHIYLPKKILVLSMFDSYLCPNLDCGYDKKDGKKGEYCPECGSPLKKMGINETNLTIAKKRETPEIRQEREIMEEQKKIQKIKAEKEKKYRQILFDDELSDPSLKISIQRDMRNLASHEAGTKWMRVGTLLSFNSTEQMIGAGFKAIIDQNKILIKQNEQILRELKKSNNNTDSDSN